MLTLLKFRTLFITVLFGAFGGALSLLLKIEDLKNYYPALAALIALIVTLLISFLIKGRWTTKLRNKLKIVAVILFALFLIAAAFHTFYIIDRTFEYREFDKVNRYVKGEYSEEGLKYKKDYPRLKDQEILYNYFEGTNGIEIYWNKPSIDRNIFRLLITYCLVVIFFVASVSLLTEILSAKYSKSIKKISV